MFKDYGFDGTLFQAADGSTLTFDKFYGTDANSINEGNVAVFLKNLGVVAVSVTEESEEYEGQEETTVAEDSDKKDWTETEVKRYEFWKEFFDYAQSNSEFVKYYGGVKTASIDQWKNFSVKGVNFSFVIYQKRSKNELELQVYFNETKDGYHNLFSHKNEIEQEMNVIYQWLELPDKKASKIVETKTNVLFEDKASRPGIFDFCIDRLLRMREVFPKYANK